MLDIICIVFTNNGIIWYEFPLNSLYTQTETKVLFYIIVINNNIIQHF